MLSITISKGEGYQFEYGVSEGHVFECKLAEWSYFRNALCTKDRVFKI